MPSIQRCHEAPVTRLSLSGAERSTERLIANMMEKSDGLCEIQCHTIGLLYDFLGGRYLAVRSVCAYMDPYGSTRMKDWR